MVPKRVITVRMPVEQHAQLRQASAILLIQGRSPNSMESIARSAIAERVARIRIEAEAGGLDLAAIEVDAGDGPPAGPCAEGCTGPARSPHDSRTGPADRTA